MTSVFHRQASRLRVELRRNHTRLLVVYVDALCLALWSSVSGYPEGSWWWGLWEYLR